MTTIQQPNDTTPSQRKVVMLRAKLVDQFRRQYLKDGKSMEEATELALALVKGTRFLRN